MVPAGPARTTWGGAARSPASQTRTRKASAIKSGPGVVERAESARPSAATRFAATAQGFVSEIMRGGGLIPWARAFGPSTPPGPRSIHPRFTSHAVLRAGSLNSHHQRPISPETRLGTTDAIPPHRTDRRRWPAGGGRDRGRRVRRVDRRRAGAATPSRHGPDGHPIHHAR